MPQVMEPPKKTETLLEMKDISLAFNNEKVLCNFNLTLNKGDKLAVLGPSGAGKSTIIKLIAGLIEPDSGEIHIKDKRIALAFQQGALFTSFNVEQNLKIVLRNDTDFDQSKITQRIDEVLSLVGLSESKKSYPYELSGGMQKRVGIARALAVTPDIMLYDEPFAGLDPVLSARLDKDLATIHEKYDITALMVTHEFHTNQHIANKVALLYEGNFIYEGSIEDFFKTNDPYAKQYRERQIEGPIHA